MSKEYKISLKNSSDFKKLKTLESNNGNTVKSTLHNFLVSKLKYET